MTILDRSGSRIVSIDFVDTPFHGSPAHDDGELCTMSPKDGTTTCHRYCTAYVVSNGKPVTLAMTYVPSDETEADAVERVLDRVAAYPFESTSCLRIVASTTSVRSAVQERLLRRLFRSRTRESAWKRNWRRTGRT